MIDVLIVGCGIIGTAVAYELSRYNINVTAVDRLGDVAGETTRANSGLIHAGFDPEPNTLMAKLNVRGSKLAYELCEKLDIPYKQNGALVLGFNEADRAVIEKLYRNGVENKVEGLEIISGDKARKIEPRLSVEVECALYAPTSAIISPWDFAIALAETAARNGVKFSLNTEVAGIKAVEGGYLITTSGGGIEGGKIEAKAVVNAAGLYADEVHGFLKEPDFKIIPNRGQYYLLDKSEGNVVSHTIFQCPNEFGKGVLVTPTVHGNLMVGPSSESVDCGNNVDTDVQTLDYVWKTAEKSVPGLNKRENIRNFSGVRAVSNVDDFIVCESAKGFYDLAGIKSPGLSSAPAIAEELISMMRTSGFKLSLKEKFVDERKVTRFRYADDKKRAELIRKNPAYGHIVCRCENITEGEILEAFNSPLPPTTVDAIKRRCHAGMGRCQGGFCAPRIIELISKHFDISPKEVLKDQEGSHIVTDIKGEWHDS